MSSEFWKAENQALTDALKQRLLGSRERLTYSELARLDLPEVLRTYLRIQTRKALQAEYPLQWKPTPRYDPESPRIKTVLGQLRDVLQDETSFSRDEIARMVDIAVGLELGLILRPRATLEEILFKKTDRRPKEEVIEVVRRFCSQRPYLQALLKYIEAHPLETVTLSEFHSLANQADGEMQRPGIAKALGRDVEDLLGLVNQARGENQRTLRVPLLIGFLEERHLDDIAQQLLLEESSESNEWDIDEFKGKLAKAIARREELKRVAVVPPPEPVKPREGAEVEIPIAVKPPPATEAKAPEVAALAQEVAAQVQAEPRKPRIIFSDAEEGVSATMIIERQTIERQPPGPYVSLQTLITDRDRKGFIKKIFKKDVKAYEKFIGELDALATWKEAKAQINAELARREVDPFSKEATRLGDLVFERYFKKKR